MNTRVLPLSFYISIAFILVCLAVIDSVEASPAKQPNPLSCDLMMDNLLPIIEQKQLDHYIYHGSFFQGLPTHNDPPSGNEQPDNAFSFPTDQPITWYEFLGADMPVEMPCRLTINVYDGENGRGYDVVIEYSDIVRGRQPAGVVCNRVDSIGAKSKGRNRSWECFSALQ